MSSDSDVSGIGRRTAVLTSTNTSPSIVIEAGDRDEAAHASMAMNAGQELRGASFAGAAFNFVKGMLGAGILALPHAVRQCGFWVSTIMGTFLLIVCYSSMYYLTKVCPYNSYRPSSFFFCLCFQRTSAPNPHPLSFEPFFFFFTFFFCDVCRQNVLLIRT